MSNKVKYVHDTATHNLNAASNVVPLLIKIFNPKSVLDVGCGLGTWLKVFFESGVKQIMGLDGNYVDQELLAQNISPAFFQPVDLALPFNLQKKFDLVVSLEVAEHLPEESAQLFVESLTLHGDIIVFSAAIPGQGGQNHINEQWKEYWIKKFSLLGYEAYDIIRPLIWNNAEVEWWYKQNIIVLSSADLLDKETSLKKPLEMIHPELYNRKLDYIHYLENQVRELEELAYKS